MSQNLDKLGKKDMLQLSGGFNYNALFYKSNGIAARRDPYTWFFNGNITATFLDVSLPFTYSYSNQQGTFTQPFNMTNCNPTYKWVKGYAGFNGMTFSNYTLAGHVFLGGGIELSPKNWRIAAMYGRLNKAVPYDVTTNSDDNMAYKRMGYGAKIGYEKKGYAITGIYFTAKDDVTSLTIIPTTTQKTPQSNTVISLSGKATIYKSLTVEGEYALSALNRNLLAEKEVAESIKNKLPVLFTPNSTAQFYRAYKSSLNYTREVYTVGLNYEHIDPNYKTLGAYFFNNDLENYTISIALRLLKSKLTISTNTGLQKNNLDLSKLSTTKRIVGSINAGYVPTSKWTINASFSNFTSYTNVRPVNDPYYIQTPADTLNFYQLTQSTTFSTNYNFGKQKAKQGITLSSNVQRTGEKTGTFNNVPTKIYNGNIGYSYLWTPTKTNASLSFNYNRGNMQNTVNTYFGPNLTISQTLVNNKLRLTVGTGYNKMLTNGIANSKLFNCRVGTSFNPKLKNEKYGKPSIGLNVVYINKFKTTQQIKSFSELTGTVNLGYTF